MQNRTVKVFLLMVTVLGVAGAAHHNNKEKSKRQPSSISKKIFLPVPSGKHLAAVKVDIVSKNEIPESGPSEVILEGRILLNLNNESGISYKWLLPAGVKITNGAIESANAGLSKGDVLKTEITVQGFTRETQKKISLQAITHRGEETLGGTALIVSRPEETLEAKAPQMRAELEAFNKVKPKRPRGL